MANRNESFQDAQKYEINCMGEPAIGLSELKISKNKRSIILHQHQQQVIPEEMSPYVTSHTLSNRLYALKNPTNCNTGLIGENIKSAKIIKMKELESELNLRRSQLNEVVAENRLLKALQRRQEHALKNYEQSKGQLPQLMQAHSEEIKVLKAKCKKMSAQNRDLEKRLRDREAELQTLQDQHRHLLKLSKDRNLGEREKLQEEVIYLKQMLESMDAQLQELSRKRAIEHKVHQQQIQQEINRSKECRKALLCAEKQINRLEEMLKLSGKNIITEKITADYSKMVKSSSAAPTERLPSIIQNHQMGAVDRSFMQENEKTKPLQLMERKLDLCIKGIAKEDKVHSKSSTIHKIEISKVFDDSKPTTFDTLKSTENFHLSSERPLSRESKVSESNIEDILQSSEESENENEVNGLTIEEKKIKEMLREESTLPLTEKSIENEGKETSQKENRIDSSKRLELLKALREMDAKELSDSDAEEVDFGPSTSDIRSRESKKSPVKSKIGLYQNLSDTERRHSIGSKSSPFKKALNVRRTIKTDLMQELFGTLPTSETKILKKKCSETSLTFLKDVSS